MMEKFIEINTDQISMPEVGETLFTNRFTKNC